MGLYPEERPGQGPSRDPGSRLILCPLPWPEMMRDCSLELLWKLVELTGFEPVTS